MTTFAVTVTYGNRFHPLKQVIVFDNNYKQELGRNKVND